MIKKLHIFMIRAYLGPFLLTLFISLFFLIMQFLWKYIDDLMGRGLEWYTVLEFMFYVSFNLFPMALPLAILLSSIMVMGNLGESNELTALKTAGMSLFRIMLPLIAFVGLLTIGAYFFANYAWPWSNLKWKTLYWEIMEKKPAFSLQEKKFYQDIPQYAIRVMKKTDQGKKFEDVLIYHYSTDVYNRKRTIRAKRGEMKRSHDENYLVLTLQDGSIYEEPSPSEIPGSHFPYRKIYFQSAEFKFDLQGFKINRGNENLFKDSYEMLNIHQLNMVIDSVKKQNENRQHQLARDMASVFLIFRKPITPSGNPSMPHPQELPGGIMHASLQPASPVNVQTNIRAQALCDNAISRLRNLKIENQARSDNLVRYKIEWHRKFTFPLACLIIFFIGAPLGAIVKRGGLGPALVLSVILFLLYHILTITGEKMARTQSASVETGMWLGAMVLIPVGAFLTWQAARESTWLYHPRFLRFLSRLSVFLLIFRRIVFLIKQR